MESKKPLRETERAWSSGSGRKINVRSTLWAGPRGGAAMTAACLILLHKSPCPIWPWHEGTERGLLVEAFPAAQLCQWEMEFEGYNGDSPEALSKRAMLVALLSKLIEIPDGSLRREMEHSADALDAVLCAFAAIAVSTGKLAQRAMRAWCARRRSNCGSREDRGPSLLVCKKLEQRLTRAGIHIPNDSASLAIGSSFSQVEHAKNSPQKVRQPRGPTRSNASCG
jgi:hypothetical protein